MGDLGLISRLGRSLGEGKDYPLQYSGLGNSTDCIVHGIAKSQILLSDLHNTSGGFPCGSAGEESTCNPGDLGSIPGLGRSPGEGKGYPLLYSCLENLMDHIVGYN